MQRIFGFALLAAVLAALVAIPALAQESLADQARDATKTKKPRPANEVVYTNDNLPTGPKDTSEAPPPAPATQGANDQSADKDKGEKSLQQTEADRKKQETEWRKKFADAKHNIELLQRELDVTEREHQLQAAAFYADAGTRLRNDRAWADKERDYQAQTDAKKKAIADAQQKLEDLKEQLRKANLPSSWAE